MGGQVKMKEQKRSSKTIDIVNYASKVRVDNATCVWNPFQVIRHILKCVNWLNSYHLRVHQNMCDWQ